WNYYMTQQSRGTVAQIDSHGTFMGDIVSGLTNATGIVPFPPGVVNTGGLSNHLFVSTEDMNGTGTNAIWNVDPVAKTATLVASLGSSAPDGIAFNTDGSILYIARVDDHIIGIDPKTGAQVYDSGLLSGVGIDGVAVGLGTLTGNLFGNFHDG